MRPWILLASFVMLSFTAMPAQAQGSGPGITEPLRTSLTPLRNGVVWRQGTVLSDIYYFYIEPVIPNVAGQEITTTMWLVPANAPVYDGRAFRYPKEELHYGAVDWRSAPPGSYVLYAMVTWPDGTGAVTGNSYSQGGVILDLPILIF